MATELLKLSELSASQASKEITHNEALRQLEGQLVAVLSRSTMAPPGSPANGATYIIPAGATGAWSGRTGQIAHYYGGSWHYYAPVRTGAVPVINELGVAVYYDGSAWRVVGESVADAAVAVHEAKPDPHPQYTTAAEAAAAAPVQSVNGKDGAVVLTAGDVGADPAGTAAQAVADHEAKGPLAHAVATPSAHGFMSAADKAKVDALKSAANENVGTDPLDLPRNRRLGTAAFIDWEQFEAYLKAKYGLTQV